MAKRSSFSTQAAKKFNLFLRLNRIVKKIYKIFCLKPFKLRCFKNYIKVFHRDNWMAKNKLARKKLKTPTYFM